MPQKQCLHTFIFQFYGALVASLAILNMGTLVGYPTNTLSQWKNETNVQVLGKSPKPSMASLKK